MFLSVVVEICCQSLKKVVVTLVSEVKSNILLFTCSTFHMVLTVRFGVVCWSGKGRVVVSAFARPCAGQYALCCVCGVLVRYHKTCCFVIFAFSVVPLSLYKSSRRTTIGSTLTLASPGGGGGFPKNGVQSVGPWAFTCVP